MRRSGEGAKGIGEKGEKGKRRKGGERTFLSHISSNNRFPLRAAKNLILEILCQRLRVTDVGVDFLKKS